MKINFILLLIAFFPIVACATKSVQFNADVKSQVSLVTPASLQETGTVVGDTPATVEVDALEGKVVRVASPGKAPIYWMLSDLDGYKTEITFKMVDVGGAGPSKAETNESENANAGMLELNQSLRLILKSYQALVSKDFSVAKDLAAQASTLNPKLAAPFIIKGLVAMQEGDADEARGALMTAKSLDPQDAEIDVLLQEIQ